MTVKWKLTFPILILVSNTLSEVQVHNFGSVKQCNSFWVFDDLCNHTFNFTRMGPCILPSVYGCPKCPCTVRFSGEMAVTIKVHPILLPMPLCRMCQGVGRLWIFFLWPKWWTNRLTTTKFRNMFPLLRLLFLQFKISMVSKVCKVSVKHFHIV